MFDLESEIEQKLNQALTEFKQHFMTKVNTQGNSADSCWFWLAGKRNPTRKMARYPSQNYGTIKFRGKDMLAHRVSYILHKGEIPSGYVIMHTCDNANCVNPNHLVCGTQAENMKQAAQNSITYKQGSKHSQAKISEKDALEIRKLYSSGIGSTTISKMYPLSKVAIMNIVNRKTWKHI